MATVYAKLVPALWVLWLLYWWIASRGVKAATRVESIPSRLAHVLPLMLAGYLIGAPKAPISWLSYRFLPAGLAAAYWAGTALVAAGLAFTVWARVHIGRNWSGTVTVKAGHELVRSGPYGLVRHPIYTGLLVAFIGSALAIGQSRGVLAVVLVFLAFWRKLRVEERWMTEVFGERYREYREQVSALIPVLF